MSAEEPSNGSEGGHGNQSGGSTGAGSAPNFAFPNANRGTNDDRARVQHLLEVNDIDEAYKFILDMYVDTCGVCFVLGKAGDICHPITACPESKMLCFNCAQPHNELGGGRLLCTERLSKYKKGFCCNCHLHKTEHPSWGKRNLVGPVWCPWQRNQFPWFFAMTLYNRRDKGANLPNSKEAFMQWLLTEDEANSGSLNLHKFVVAHVIATIQARQGEAETGARNDNSNSDNETNGGEEDESATSKVDRGDSEASNGDGNNEAEDEDEPATKKPRPNNDTKDT